MKNVHNYLHVIEHDPLARRKPVDRDGAQTMIGFKTRLDFARDCFEMWLRGAGADHKKIGKSRNTLEIEDDDLLRFLIRRQVSGGFG